MSSSVLELRSSPHIKAGHSVEIIMFNVVLALVPTAAFAVYLFGLAAVAVLVTAIASCLLTEFLLSRRSGARSTIGDWSAVITGLLFGLTVPPSLPLWMVFVGGVISIALGKFAFGGLGFNSFNPALVGRAVLQATFPVAMTTWLGPGLAERYADLPAQTLTLPFARPEVAVDAVSTATPLAAWKFDHVLTDTGELFFGMSSGSAGETSAILIAVGGLWLIARRMMSWRIPLAILGTVAAFSGLLHLIDPAAYAPPAFMLLSGGVMLGATFMATDMVGSPMACAGQVIYGAFIGALVVVIRTWGGMPEGVMYAILLGNAITPHIDRAFQPRVFGTREGDRR